MINPKKKIILTDHAKLKMADRGASEVEVVSAIEEGSCEPARNNRFLLRRNFSFNAIWRGKYYSVKQVAPIVKEEDDKIVVITVYVYYFKEEIKDED